MIRFAIIATTVCGIRGNKAGRVRVRCGPAPGSRRRREGGAFGGVIGG